MSEILYSAIAKVQSAKYAFCRFITANDTGKNGSHQAGFYIPKCAAALLFDTPRVKGENKDKFATVKWQNDFITESRFIYYGQGTRNEYRITRFGKNFPFFEEDNVGDLLIIAQKSENYYYGFVLQTDQDIDDFFAFFNLSPDETNQLIDISGFVKPDMKIKQLIENFIGSLQDFPETRQMALGARECYNEAYNVVQKTIINHPDDVLLNWIDTEYSLFKCMEEKVYRNVISHPFESVESFVQTANEVLNRRKSRAGKSLEHHLAYIFSCNDLIFEEQAITEDNKKPDFLFPNGECYHNMLFPTENLTVLGAKTTCKDRWRQVLTEADRVKEKYLFTLQQGISRNQLKEMQDSELTLVVPHKYISNFPMEYQNGIKDLANFIQLVKEKQEHAPKHYLFT